jgi:hypothetical protein
MVGTPDDRAIVYRMREMATGLAERRAASVRAVSFAISRYHLVAGDAERWSADMTLDVLNRLASKRAATKREQVPTPGDVSRRTPENLSRFSKKILDMMTGECRHRIVTACHTIETLGALEQSFLELAVEDVCTCVAKAARSKPKGDNALGAIGCCAKLCVKTNAFGLKNEASARTARRTAVKEMSGRRA